MSHQLSPATHLLLIRYGSGSSPETVSPPARPEPQRAALPAPATPAPDPLRGPRAEPYSVRRVPSVGGVKLIGHDGRGFPMVELRIPAQKFKRSMVLRMQQWLRDNDDGPRMEIVRPETPDA